MSAAAAANAQRDFDKAKDRLTRVRIQRQYGQANAHDERYAKEAMEAARRKVEEVSEG